MGGEMVVARRASRMVAYGWLWPGFAGLWTAGQWQGLAVAVAFAAALNLTIIGSLVYSELLTGAAAWGAWMGVGLFWFVGVAGNRRRQKAYDQTRIELDSEQDLFPQALNEYLQGNWFAVAAECRSILRRRADDADARLLLVGALRRAGNLAEAQAELRRLETFESAQKWLIEIEHERELLNETEEEANATIDAAAAAGDSVRRAA